MKHELFEAGGVLRSNQRRQGGLLGFHFAAFVVQVPTKCKPGELAREEERMSQVTGETRDNELKVEWEGVDFGD